MKILLLTTSYPSFSPDEKGIPRGKFVHDMARAFVQKGNSVVVSTHRSQGSLPRSTQDGVEIRRFRYFIPGLETLTAGAGIPENIGRIQNKILAVFYILSQLVQGFLLIRKEKPDWINAHWAFPTGWVGLILKRLTGKPLIITAYGAEVFPLEKGRMKFLVPLLKKALREADQVAAISPATADALKRISDREKILLIPDGIDINYYHPGEKNVRLLERYGLAGHPTVFFTGRMVERKGHRTLIEAAALLRDCFPELRVLLGGEGPLLRELQALRAHLKVESQVLLPGPIPEPDMVPLLRSADLYVLPSCIDETGDTEGSATAAFEAMACGTPALISRVGGNQESIDDGHGGLYFEPTNARDLAQKIERVFREPGLLESLRGQARSVILENYAWDRSIQKYLAAMDGPDLKRYNPGQ